MERQRNKNRNRLKNYRKDTFYIFQENSGNPSASFNVNPFIKEKSIIISNENKQSTSAQFEIER